MGKVVVRVLALLLDLLAFGVIIAGAVLGYLQWSGLLGASVGALAGFVFVLVFLGVHYLLIESVRGLYRVEQAIERVATLIEKQGSAGAERDSREAPLVRL